ncbi:MAG: 50S ribosomal protein L21 [Pseudomonadota bacterium]
MFAVIKTGGKQYKVSKDDEITIEKLADAPGDPVRFGEVLMLGGEGGLTVGAPRVDGAEVVGEVLDQVKADKVYSFKKRRRKHSSARLKGHRQQLTVVKITDILSGGLSVAGSASASQAAKTEAPAETESADEAATE